MTGFNDNIFCRNTRLHLFFVPQFTTSKLIEFSVVNYGGFLDFGRFIIFWIFGTVAIVCAVRTRAYRNLGTKRMTEEEKKNRVFRRDPHNASISPRTCILSRHSHAENTCLQPWTTGFFFNDRYRLHCYVTVTAVVFSGPRPFEWFFFFIDFDVGRATTSRTNHKRVKRVARLTIGHGRIPNTHFTLFVLPIPRGGPTPQIPYGYKYVYKRL